MAGLIVALDTPDLVTAQRWADGVAPHCGLFKLGLEFFCAQGRDGVRALSQDRPVFLDLKLHDIPNTVAGAVAAVLPLAPAMLTVHASGGEAMVAAARAAIDQAAAPRVRLIAVTVLTSLDEPGLRSLGVAEPLPQQALRLARLAVAAGADGLVCAPTEVATLRAALGPGPMLVVPGVRPTGGDAHDQARTAGPGETARAGADWVVVGRPITQAPDPAAAAASIVAAARG